MGVETDRRGGFRVQAHVTMQDVAALWEGHDCVRDAIANEANLPEPDAVNYRPVDGEETADFNLEDGFLAYEFYGYSFSFAKDAHTWLGDAAKDLAAEAWTDEDRSNDGFGETIYGPSERARLEHKIFTRRIMIQDAEREIEEAQAALDELGD